MWRIEREVQNLKTDLSSLPDDMRLFSRNMRSLFNDERPSWNLGWNYKQLRDKTRNDAVVYLQSILPMVRKCVEDVIQYFQIYESLTVEEWWSRIDFIIQQTQTYKETSNALVQIHQEMLKTLHERQNAAVILASELQLSGWTLKHKGKELKRSSENKRNWAIGLAFIPGVNFIATPLLLASAKKDLEESYYSQASSRNRFISAEKTGDILVPALTNFANGLNQIAGFFQVSHEAHIALQRRGETAKAVDRPKLMHFKLMKSKSEEIKRLCTMFLAKLPEIRDNFQAIPKDGTDQDYVDGCLARHRGIIQDNCSERTLEILLFFGTTC